MEQIGKFDKFPADSRKYVGEILMDVWMYCPWCGVRQWFKHKEGNNYTCTGSCKQDLEMKK